MLLVPKTTGVAAVVFQLIQEVAEEIAVGGNKWVCLLRTPEFP